MGASCICIKITDIQIPNNFGVYYKSGDTPYPIVPLTANGWELFNIYNGGTTTIMLSGATTPNFEYGSTYWIKLEEVAYPDRYVIKNIRINDCVAYQSIVSCETPTPTPTVTSTIPDLSVTPSVSLTPPVESVSPTLTPTITPSTSIGASISTTPSSTITPSITPTITPSITFTPSPSLPGTVSQVYFNTIAGNNGIMGVNYPFGRIFSITFEYLISAACDNTWSNGQDPVQAQTCFFSTIDSGATVSEVDCITAEISGGIYDPNGQYDYQERIGTYTITGITSSVLQGGQVWVWGTYNCNTVQNLMTGFVSVTITSVTVNTGSAEVICDDYYELGCPDLGPTLSCSTPSPTPTQHCAFDASIEIIPGAYPSLTPSRTPSVTPTPSQHCLFGINVEIVAPPPSITPSKTPSITPSISTPSYSVSLNYSILYFDEYANPLTTDTIAVICSGGNWTATKIEIDSYGTNWVIGLTPDTGSSYDTCQIGLNMNTGGSRSCKIRFTVGTTYTDCEIIQSGT